MNPDDRILAPGTVCFLVRVTSHAGVVGRVVEVVDAPLPVDVDPPEPGPWHLCSAFWIAEAFPGRTQILTPRRCLLPITPPQLPLDVPTRDAEPVE